MLGSSNQAQLIGTQLSGYAIKEWIGAGEWASVFLADTPDGKGRVAIKVLGLQDAYDSDVVAHFERQARLLTRIDHPHIVKIRDYGKKAELLWIVMDLAAKSLDQVLAQGPLPEDEVIAVALQIGSALECIHQKRIIHRDIKPSNILVGSHDYVLSDFGFAKVLDSNSIVTLNPKRVMNHHYLAPEIALGLKLSGRSDIFSLGSVMFHMATGKVPYSGDNPVRIVEQQIHGRLPVANDVNPAISRQLAMVIRKATTMTDRFRYASAEEFLRDVQALQQQRRSSNEAHQCLSCKHPVPAGSHHCPNCGRNSF